jgi:hypothetical protein
MQFGGIQAVYQTVTASIEQQCKVQAYSYVIGIFEENEVRTYDLN